MGNAIRERATSNMTVIRLPEDQMIGSTRILTPDECWVPTTGSNAGKHKLGNNVDVYDDLAFLEDGGGGGTGTVENVAITTANFVSGASDGNPTTPSLTLQTSGTTRNALAVAHTFTVGQALRLSGGNHVLAQGDTAANAAFVGFAYNVSNPNIVLVALPGTYMETGFSGLTAGVLYYLDPTTPGALTTTANAFGPVAIATSANGVYVMSNAAGMGGRISSYLNGNGPLVCQTAVIEGTSNAAGRVLIDMSASPYSWTQIVHANVTVVDSGETAYFVGYNALTAVTGRAYVLSSDTNPFEGATLSIELIGF